MSLNQRLVKRAFIPASPDQQQPGPDGMPVDPAAAAGAPAAAAGAPAGAPAGAAPMDPMAAAPTDPAAGAPAAPEAAPVDPTAGAPIDPATGAPVDPAAAIDPSATPAAEPEVPIDPGAAVNHGQARVVMDIVERTLTAVGKNKKNQPPTGGSAVPATDPAQQAGPVSGQPGDMSAILNGGPIKMGSASDIIGRVLKGK